MTDDHPIMPIGKYKGRSVAEVMAIDPQYAEWLTLQNWFVDKYKPTYNFIVQAGAPNDMSPEHNTLQAMFLDDDFCLQVAGKVALDWRNIRDRCSETLNYWVSRTNKDIADVEKYYDGDADKIKLTQLRENERKLQKLRKTFEARNLIKSITNRSMEDISDVAFTMHMRIDAPTVEIKGRRRH
jgi:hypothetical protein